MKRVNELWEGRRDILHVYGEGKIRRFDKKTQKWHVWVVKADLNRVKRALGYSLVGGSVLNLLMRNGGVYGGILMQSLFVFGLYEGFWVMVEELRAARGNIEGRGVVYQSVSGNEKSDTKQNVIFEYIEDRRVSIMRLEGEVMLVGAFVMACCLGVMMSRMWGWAHAGVERELWAGWVCVVLFGVWKVGQFLWVVRDEEWI